jgi:hypothetical protein
VNEFKRVFFLNRKSFIKKTFPRKVPFWTELARKQVDMRIQLIKDMYFLDDDILTFSLPISPISEVWAQHQCRILAT